MASTAVGGMFGDNEEDGVGPLVMAEDGEEWFPFTLDNLEGIDDDGDCPPLNAMEEVSRSFCVFSIAVVFSSSPIRV